MRREALRPRWRPAAGAVWVLILLAVGGCARLERISDEGGLITLSRGAPPAATETPSEADCAPEEPQVAAPRDSSSEPEIIGPYRPSDFSEHAADEALAWHWTAVRSGDRVEVKGLIHNRGTRSVQGVIFALSSPGARVRANAPGLIRPGQMRPFYFLVTFSGDEREARLSIVAVDRTVVASPAPRRCDRPAGPPSPAKQSPPASPFSDHAQDRFFSLHWKTTSNAGEVEVRGIVENRDGPTLKQVTLVISAHSAEGETLKTQQFVLPGVFGKKETRPFDVTFSVGTEPVRVSVAVHSYQFELKGF